MAITKFDKGVAKLLGKEIEEALQTIAAKHGIKITYGGGTVGPTEFVCKVRCTVTDSRTIEDQERAAFAILCEFYGLTAADYNREGTFNGKRLRLIGFTNKAKFPIKVMDVAAGKTMMYSEVVITAFGGKPIGMGNR